MRIQRQLREKLRLALKQLADSSPHGSEIDAAMASLVAMLRPAGDPRFGDYQANCAMSLGKLLGDRPRSVAERLVSAVAWDEVCEPPEIAGPGFINLRIRDDVLAQTLQGMLADLKLGIGVPSDRQTILIDYSSPNVAKPMHVGHIRSTVIGDSLARVFRFLGHHVITDNHLGDWGTQFGMVIYGFKHFGDPQAFDTNPVAELSRLYRLVNRIIEYHTSRERIAAVEKAARDASAVVDQARSLLNATTDPTERKPLEKSVVAAEKKWRSALDDLQTIRNVISAAESDSDFHELASRHGEIATAVLRETAKLHQGDEENRRLWSQFLPHCQDEIDRVYRRLGVVFDHTLGESFYHDRLADVVQTLIDRSVATLSDGAVCVFMPEFDSPMIIQKKDQAFLYATTDLATLIYRRERFTPDQILYVVDTRQSEHFEKLFLVAKRLGMESTRLVHVNFGTVLGEDGRPFKTRSGTSVGLESLLDDAVKRASAVVCDPERAEKIQPPLTDEEKEQIARVVGHGAIKYADLAHHRTSDYKFDLQKMVALDGNTSAYVQYAYARTQSILSKGETDEASVIAASVVPTLSHPAERALALVLSRFGESLDQVAADYAPNFLVDYLYETAKSYAVFNDNCPVLKAIDRDTKDARLVLVALTGRVLRTGLDLLGIGVVPRM